MTRITKNKKQQRKLMEFLSANKNILEGTCSKKEVNAFWNNVAIVLNRFGPPRKDATAWRKVWLDWKCYIKKKVTNNRETIESGLSNSKLQSITPLEKEIIELTGMDMAAASVQTLCSSDALNIPMVSIQKDNADRKRKNVKMSEDVPRKTIDVLQEVSCFTMQNQNPESSGKGEEIFCEYLCCELKKITLEDTLDDLKLHILQLVRNTIKEEKRLLQLQQQQ